MWNDMREKSRRSLVVGPPVDDAVKSENYTVTRVLVRRRVGHPEEEGQVIETQFLGHRRRDTQLPSDTPSMREGDTLTGKVKGMPMAVKVIAFGGLVAAFMGFNAWAVPKMVPKRKIPSFEAVLSSATPNSGRQCFVELGCGDGRALLEAAKHFEQVHGYEEKAWLLRLARRLVRLELDQRQQGVIQLHGRGGSGWEDLVRRADCVLVSQEDLLDKTKTLVKPGSLILLQEGGVFTIAAQQGPHEKQQ